MDGMEYALKLLSRKRYAIKELEEKLSKKHINSKPIIQRLQELNYINDAEFAHDYANKKLQEGYGKYKILYSLKIKGIDESILNSLSFANDKLEELFLKKISKLKGDNKKQKIYAFLVSRGFESEEVKNLIQKYEDKL